jgi:hypothetical protein
MVFPIIGIPQQQAEKKPEKKATEKDDRKKTTEKGD